MSLAGLDDIVAAGKNGFNILQTVSKGSYYNDHELSSVFERGRRYLKTRYALSCSEESEIASHNCLYAFFRSKWRSMQSNFQMFSKESVL